MLIFFFLKNHLFLFIQLSTDVLGTVLGDRVETNQVQS